MPIQKPDYQLSFNLDLPEETGDSTIQRLSADEIRLRSETARQVFEGRDDLKWMEEYARLRDGGWDWRVAAYIAWASSPRSSRIPKTQDELAINHLGLTSDRAIATWRKKNPAIDEMIAMLQASPLWDYRAEVFSALTENAVKPDYKTHNDRKLFLELTGDYVPSSKLAAMITKNGFSKNDLADMSDDELLKLAKNFRDEVTKDEEEE
jgi:hypothetical protein